MVSILNMSPSFLILACFKINSVASVPNPRIASKYFISPSRVARVHIFWRKGAGSPEIPKTRSKRPKGITIEAAEMKPTKTGWEIKLTMPPRLNTPRKRITQPEHMHRRTARRGSETTSLLKWDGTQLQGQIFSSNLVWRTNTIRCPSWHYVHTERWPKK